MGSIRRIMAFLKSKDISTFLILILFVFGCSVDEIRTNMEEQIASSSSVIKDAFKGKLSPNSIFSVNYMDIPFVRLKIPVSDVKKVGNLDIDIQQNGIKIRAIKTDSDGIFNLEGMDNGIYTISFPAQGIEAVLTLNNIPLVIQGILTIDTDDIDEDGDKEEALITLEIIPDGDNNGISDNGSRVEYSLTKDGGKVHYVRENGIVENTRISMSEESLVDSFFDKDDDGIIDDDDPDLNGDNILDEKQLFLSHDQYLVSPHNKVNVRFDFTDSCDDCHIIRLNDQGIVAVPGEKTVLKGVSVGDPAPRGLICYSCHKAEYDKVVKISGYNFDHKEFSKGCQYCHKSGNSNWKENVVYIHPLNQGFFLEGAHADRNKLSLNNCEECHEMTRLNGYSKAGNSMNSCKICHSNLYESVHALKPKLSECRLCHVASSWSDISFEHTLLDSGCNDCHKEDKPSSHLSDRSYDTCESCHKSSNWNFDHKRKTLFPVNHKGRSWVCSDCHRGSDYSNGGGCIECHKALGEDIHATSVNKECLNCHPTGKDEGD